MVTITDSTLRASIFETLYDTLTAANLLSSTATVTAAYIDSATAPFPQVVINPASVGKSEFSFDRTNSRKDITVVIDLWVRKNKHKDQLTDEIDVLITPLSIPGLQFNGWDESDALETPNDNKIHLKSIVLTYMRA